MSPKSATGSTPEWRGRVGIMNGKRWLEAPVIVRAVHPHVAVSRAIEQARRSLPKGTRVVEVFVKLRRTPNIKLTGDIDARDMDQRAEAG